MMRFYTRMLLGFILNCALLAVPAMAGEGGIADFPGLSATTDWPWWRGPTRDGVASNTPVPTTLSDTENLLWKVQVPGRGHSSPIVVGNRVYLTTALKAEQKHFVLAFDRTTGAKLWQEQVNQGAFPARNHSKNTEATPSVACDGERLFTTFYHHDMVETLALSVDGKVLWKKKVAPFRPKAYEYGYAPSPLIYQNTVIVTSEYDGDSFISALDRATGDQVWQTKRLPMISFSSPVVGHVAGKDQLLLSGAGRVSSYDPAKGEPLWSVLGTTLATCGTMVWDDKVVFASGGFPKAETVAVVADGSNKVLWKNNQKCYEQSMLAHDGHVYAFNDQGIMFCWRGTDGKEMWRQRLGGLVSASPVLANGNIYWANESGTLFVFKATPEKYDQLAKNQIGDSSFASPAICGGQVFLRVAKDGQEWLYCFGNKSK